MENLQFLDLSATPISTLKENAFGHLSMLEEIKLDSEQILCDCKLNWFPRWINVTGIRGVEARCAHPESLKARSILAIDFDSFTCDDFPKPYILLGKVL